MHPFVDRFVSTLTTNHPMMVRSVLDAHSLSSSRVQKNFHLLLQCMVQVYGDDVFDAMCDAYAWYTLYVNKSQLEYEKRGSYEFSTFSQVNGLVYQDDAYMSDYYYAISSILFCWPHYVQLVDFFLDKYVPIINGQAILEVAPGHGFWGIMALLNNSSLRLDAFDISPGSLVMAPQLAKAAGLTNRVSYHIGDATRLDELNHPFTPYNACICSFMLEHLENPQSFLTSLHAQLAQDSYSFVTLALTASQADHIYEFVRESEAVLMAENAGFQVKGSLCTQPARLNPNLTKIPRVQALILYKS